MLQLDLKTLSCYSEEAKQWRQAHAAARFAILKACLRWGNDTFFVIKTDTGFRLALKENGLENIKETLIKLLIYLNYYKSTSKPVEGKKFFNYLINLDDFFLDVRKYSMSKQVSRNFYVGAIVELIGNKYVLASQVEKGKNANALNVLYSNLLSINVSTTKKRN